jgi:hypothetical protein
MTSRSLARLLLTTVALAVFAAPAVTVAAPARTRPAGSVRAAKRNVRRAGKTVCLKVGRSWLPAAALRGGWYVTHAQQRKNYAALARRARGARARAYRRQAEAFRRKDASGRKACAPAPRRSGFRNDPPTPGSGSNPGPGQQPDPTPRTPTPLRFDLSGAAGLALQNLPTAVADRRAGVRSGAIGAPLVKVAPDGAQSNAVTSGKAKVTRVVIGPDDAAYVVFSSKVYLPDATEFGAPPGAGCLFARVPRADGVPTCVDLGIDTISAPPGFGLNPPIQFDASGAVYYLGNAGGSTILRRSSGGQVTTLISDQTMVGDFLVLPDGSVLVKETVMGTGTTRLARIVPGGGRATVQAGAIGFLRAFPDGNAYFGTPGGAYPGIARYLTATGTRDPQPWLAEAAATPAPVNELDPFCGGPVPEPLMGLCGSGGSALTATATVGDELFAATGVGTQSALTRLYPSVQLPPTQVVQPTVLAAAGDRLAVAGLDALGRNMLTLFDPDDDGERTLIGPANEVEVYHLRYRDRENALLFDGLRYADNTVVLGRVDLTTGALTTTAVEGGVKWEAFETFD